MNRVRLQPLTAAGIDLAQATVKAHHYLHAKVSTRASVEGYAVLLGATVVGYLLLGRTEAQKCYPFYGAVAEVQAGLVECSRWGVLNLYRVWFDPTVQPGGAWYSPVHLPGYCDRKGWFQSTLARDAIRLLLTRVGYEYLERRPPCFLHEPYALTWLISYCDTTQHKGTIYRAAGFTRYRVNDRGIETWRIALPALTPAQDARVRWAAAHSARSITKRAERWPASRQEAFAL